jgi:hypothetical protein
LPFGIFFDDFEPNNCLGSHKGTDKVGGTYGQFFCLPPEISSKQKFIILVSLHFYKHRKFYGLSRIYDPVTDMLNKLATTGIHLKNPILGKTNVKILTVFTLGDNLGLNEGCGMVESFNANYYCRLCRMNKENCQSCLREDPNILRNLQNREIDEKQQSGGVKNICVFDRLKYYSSVENCMVDPMHDILHGICSYDFIVILFDCLSNNDFSISDLNACIQSCQLPPHMAKNRPPPINSNFMKNKKISMSASEWSVFTHWFGIFMGTKIPNDSNRWQLYIKLREIINLVFEDSLIENLKSDCNILEESICNHHKLYLNVSQEALKPKFHFLLHYPGLKRKYFSLKLFACNRFEQSHQFFKKVSNSTPNRINLLHTLAIKDHIKLAEDFRSFENDLKINLEVGNLSAINDSSINSFKPERCNG